MTYDPELPAGFQDADFDMRELEDAAARMRARERAKRAHAVKLRNAQLLASLTYAEAEARHDAGTLSAGGWLCYRVCWCLSAPRFSELAADVRALVTKACNDNAPPCPLCDGAGIFDPLHGTAVNIGPTCPRCNGNGFDGQQVQP